MTDVPIYVSVSSAGAATIAASIKAIRTQYRDPDFDDLDTLMGGADYARASLAVITAAGYPATAFFRSNDTFMPDGTTDATNGGYWLNVSQVLRPEMFGLFSNATVTTATLLAALAYATMSRRLMAWGGGDYEINSSITPAVGVAGAELHLQLEGDVRVSVSSGASRFAYVIYLESTVVTSHSIGGNGTLSIDCNGRAAAGLWLRHTASSAGGTVTLDQPLRISNVFGTEAVTTAAGIAVFGRFERVVIRSPEVVEVTRDYRYGECSGIAVSGFAGLTEIYAPVIKRIRTGQVEPPVDPADEWNDADGIKCFGQSNGDPLRRKGVVRIYSPTFEDCQGRSYKDQSSGDAILFAPVFRRDGGVLIGIRNGHDADFQMGGGLVLDAQANYRAGPTEANGSPLGERFSVFAFQQLQSDHTMYAAARNTVIRSDVAVPNVAIQVDQDTAAESVTELDGVTLIPTNGLIGTMITDAILRVSLDDVATKAGTTTYRVLDVEGPNTWPIIGYDSAPSTSLSGKLIVDVRRANNPLGPDPLSVARAGAFRELSGTRVLRLESFRHEGLNGYCDLYVGAFHLDFREIPVGTTFTVDIAAYVSTPSAVINNPSWGTSGYAHVRCFSQWYGGADRVIEVQKDGGSANPSVWRTQDGGASWAVLK